MKAGWAAVPLKELCSDYKSAIVDGPFGSNLKREHFQSEGVPVLKIQNVKLHTINQKKLDYVSAEKAEQLSRHSFVKGDIIMTKLGDPLGVSAIVDDIDLGIIVADLVRIRVDKIDTKFLCYQLNSPAIKDAINRQQKGATRPRVKISMVRDLIVNLPPLAEQKQIVSMLDQAFAGIERAAEAARKNRDNARELFETTLNATFTQKGEGWELRKLGDEDVVKIIDGDRGSNYPKKTDFFEEGYCLFLNTKNVRPDGFNFDTTMYISKEKDAALRKGKLRRHDVLLTTRGTIGNIALYDDDVPYENIRINSGMLIFRPKEKVLLSDYLFEMFRSSFFKSQVSKYVSGAAQPQLPIKTLVKFDIPVPKALDEQRSLVKMLREIWTQAQRLETLYQQKLDALEELKQSLLQKAFAGELTADFNAVEAEAAVAS